MIDEDPMDEGMKISTLAKKEKSVFKQQSQYLCLPGRFIGP